MCTTDRALQRRSTTMMVVAFFLAFVASPSLLSQLISSDVSQYGHTSWLTRDGYFRGNLNAVTQTKDGYIWIGTGFDLVRFDGAQFVSWHPATGQRLPVLPISKLLGARDGSLWMGGNGLARLKDGKITTFPALDGVAVFAILEESNGDVWAGGLKRGSANQLCRIRGQQAECYGDSHTFGIFIRSLFEDKRGNLWVGAETGLWRWKPGPPKLFADQDTTAAMSIAEDSAGTLIMAEDSETHYLSKQGKNLRYDLRVRGKLVGAARLLTDRNGGLWIGTSRQGLVHIFHGRVDTYTSIDGLSSDDVIDMFEDSEGDIWVVTGAGLDCFHALAIPTITKKQGLSGNGITSVLSDGHTTWVGSFQGLDRITDKTITHLSVRNGLAADDTRSLYLEKPGKLLVASGSRDGLTWLEGGRATRLHVPSGENTFVIATDGAAGLWLSNRETGLIHVGPDGKPIDTFAWDYFGGHSATAIAYDSTRNGLWLAFMPGDLEFFRNRRVEERYLLNGQEKFVNPRNLQVSADGAVWVGSSAGLTRLWKGKVSTLSSRNGLPCDAVHWRKDDGEQTTWLETECGIVHLPKGELDRWAEDPDRKVQILDHFDNSDGAENVAIGHYYSPPVTTTADGRLLFVTLSGLAVIDPHRNAQDSTPPPVRIERLQADARDYSLDKAVVLPPHIHVLRLAYTALSYRTPQKIRYRYRLEGYDPNWTEALSAREAIYTNLPPGHYRFRVIACNDRGIWNEAGDAIDVKVQPSVFQTVWFRSLSVVMFAALIWLGYLARLRYLCQKISERIEVQTSERLHISRDLHDTLLQAVEGVTLSFHALTEQLPRDAAMRQKMLAVLDRADEVIVEGRNRIGALRFEDRAGRSIIHDIVALGEQNNADKGIDFEVVVNGKETVLSPIVLEEVFSICREALNNAFRHAGARRIEVVFTFGTSRFSVVVRDDGRGIDPMVVSSGAANGHWGIIGMRERASRLGARFEIRNASKLNRGTEVEIQLPARAAYLRAAR